MEHIVDKAKNLLRFERPKRNVNYAPLRVNVPSVVNSCNIFHFKER